MRVARVIRSCCRSAATRTPTTRACSARSLGRRPDALLITGSGYSPAALQMLIEARIPVVEIWEYQAGRSTWRSASTTCRSGAEVAAFLLAKGHDRFAIPDGAGFTARWRARAASPEPSRAGGDGCLEQVTAGAEHDGGGAGGPALAVAILDQRCALLCSSDLMAFGVIPRRGCRGTVPEHLAVCGFGNLELSAQRTSLRSPPSVSKGPRRAGQRRGSCCGGWRVRGRGSRPGAGAVPHHGAGDDLRVGLGLLQATHNAPL